MKKKILAIALVVAMLAVAIVSASLAYFTDEDYATNTFTVGEVDIDLQEDFGQEKENDDRIDDTDTYTEYFYPGVEVNKDVWVKNTSTTNNKAYVRVHVAIPADLAPTTINGTDGLVTVTLFENITEATYNDSWQWTDTYSAKVNDIECKVFVATYQKELAKNELTDIDAITSVRLNADVDTDIVDGVLKIYKDVNKDGKLSAGEKSAVAQTNPFIVEIEVAAEAVQVEGMKDIADNGKNIYADALDTAFGIPGTYDLSTADDEATEFTWVRLPSANP